MPTCKTCSPKAKPEEVCVLAAYRTRVGGAEMVFCCENSAREFLKGRQGGDTAKPRKKAAVAKRPKK